MNPVIVDDRFPGEDTGTVVPLRNGTHGEYGLTITNLDHSDPPETKPNSYSRAEAFNKNVLTISDEPKMPRIDVVCRIVGFDPATSPLIWRLQTNYVVGRYEKIDHSASQPRYKSLLDRHTGEWTGTAHTDRFSLFSDDPNVSYDNFSDRVAGGHCVLTVAWMVPGADVWLQDFVHIRIGGTNPTHEEIRNHTARTLTDRDPNLLRAANAVFAWEADMKQFDPRYRTGESYKGVRFNWPHDPPQFPLVAFDFGIGISQYTHWGQETTGICWDWRNNVDAGIDELLDDFRSQYSPGLSWIDWCKRAWGAYNGSGVDGSYAANLESSPDGLLISRHSIPRGFDVRMQTAHLPAPKAAPRPRPWPIAPVDAVATLPSPEAIATLDHGGVEAVSPAELPIAAAVSFVGPAITDILPDRRAVLRSLAAAKKLSDAMDALIAFSDRRGSDTVNRYWAIADFDLKSSMPRFFLFDAEAAHVEAYLCAHGRGSEGASDDGFASVFSNVSGSNCTSLGVYSCAEPYTGHHGYSLRLDGLEATNSHARPRKIVIHGADYVSPETIARTGRIGRSDGCFALENRYVTDVVTHLTGGSLLLAWYAKAHEDRVAESAGAPVIWSELELPAAVEETEPASTVADLAKRLLASDRVIFARTHSVSPADNADAHQNMVDTAAGGPASRSPPPKAPGGTVALDARMLKGLLSLTETYSVSVSEICGGVHNRNSRHYAGCAMDIGAINGQKVSAKNPYVALFKQKCRDLGANEVLGPGDPGHATHVHAGWPRP